MPDNVDREDDEGPGQGMGRLLALSDGVFAFAGTIGAAALTGTVIWAYAWTREQLVDPRRPAAADLPAVIAAGLGGLITVAICLVSIAVAVADPRAGELIWIAFLVPNRWTTRWLRPCGGWLLAIRARLHGRRPPQPAKAD